MQCESCHQRPATVHNTKILYDEAGVPKTEQEQHLCQQCADDFYACTPDLAHMRDLICLSDFYRSKLYDLMETKCPYAFDEWDGVDRGAQIERVKSMQAFFR